MGLTLQSQKGKHVKTYEMKVNGTPRTFQFRDGEVPKGATEVKAGRAPKNKAVTPKTKSTDPAAGGDKAQKE